MRHVLSAPSLSHSISYRRHLSPCSTDKHQKEKEEGLWVIAKKEIKLNQTRCLRICQWDIITVLHLLCETGRHACRDLPTGIIYKQPNWECKAQMYCETVWDQTTSMTSRVTATLLSPRDSVHLWITPWRLLCYLQWCSPAQPCFCWWRLLRCY